MLPLTVVDLFVISVSEICSQGGNILPTEMSRSYYSGSSCLHTHLDMKHILIESLMYSSLSLNFKEIRGKDSTKGC